MNLGNLASDFGENVGRLMMGRIAREARSRVAVDTRNLQNSIKAITISKKRFSVIASTEYAAAQEWGLAKFGKPNYTFTPYMTPASKHVLEPRNLSIIVKEGYDGAVEKAKRRARK
jgi:hypothetical protein